MPLWKCLLLSSYYHLSLPYRNRRNRQAAEAGRAPVIVLLYHRIADDAANAWTMSNAMFRKQIDWLRRNYDIVSLADAQQRISSGNNNEPCVAITFDDGYAINCQHALPLLVRERIPCTYFVTTEAALNGGPFQHDLAMGHRFEPNTLEQLKALAGAGIEIGAHTRTHADIGQVTDPDELFDELVVARDELQAALGHPIRYFAFPFGQHRRLSAQAIHLAQRNEYEAVCSAYGGYNFPGDDPFHIQRIPADESFIRLKNWVTVDPRKVRSIRHFYYGALASENSNELLTH